MPWSHRYVKQSHGVFSLERERFVKDANVEKIAKSNIRIVGSKSSPNMRAGFGSVVNCSLDAGHVRKNFKLFFF